MSPREASSSGGSRRRGGGIRDWLTPARATVLVIALLAIIFIFENTRQVKIRLLIPEVTMPLYLALLAMFAVGVLCGGYFFRRRVR
ncbi:lipopolysaccharide assembly protein LapA domain-containing protein [Streptomyces sp. MUM 178J]|uniref:lipopolysaccharide assembly protein LapA domain-containing protein n=1 Tax=Streptomyces sp. MUM 178J TaxID=2791991 RepID=UPI001F04ECB0|nr:LapA family protein [Streptomyces sp. MUM 178J]WRQ80226.1 LapA family protein [Streptomyces sp. MUM 178J]